MENNPLHNAMIRYIHNKMLLMQAFQTETWAKFKKAEGVGLAEDHTATDLANIFKNEILPNIRDYECVQQDAYIQFYMGRPGGIPVIPNHDGSNDNRNASNVNIFDAQSQYDRHKDILDERHPIVTDDIVSLSHGVSTQTEIQRASMHSMNQSVARLHYIENEKRSGYDLHVPKDIKTYHEIVTAAHKLYGDVRLSDIMDNNPEKLTALNRPLLLIDPTNRLPEQGGAETQNPVGSTIGNTLNTSHESHTRLNLLQSNVDNTVPRTSILPVNGTAMEEAGEVEEVALRSYADLLPKGMFITSQRLIISKRFPDIFNIRRHQWPVLAENGGWEKLYPTVSGPIRPQGRRGRRSKPEMSARPRRSSAGQATPQRPAAGQSALRRPPVRQSTPLRPTDEQSTSLRSSARQSTTHISSTSQFTFVGLPDGQSTPLRPADGHSTPLRPPAEQPIPLRSSAVPTPTTASTTQGGTGLPVIAEPVTTPPDYFSPTAGPSGRPRSQTFFGSEYDS